MGSLLIYFYIALAVGVSCTLIMSSFSLTTNYRLKLQLPLLETAANSKLIAATNKLKLMVDVSDSASISPRAEMYRANQLLSRDYKQIELWIGQWLENQSRLRSGALGAALLASFAIAGFALPRPNIVHVLTGSVISTIGIFSRKSFGRGICYYANLS